jgi:hypothetical protein
MTALHRTTTVEGSALWYPLNSRRDGQIGCVKKTTFSCLAGNRAPFSLNTSYFFELHLNILLPSMSRFSNWCLLFTSSEYEVVSVSHYSRDSHIPLICREGPIAKLCSLQFTQTKNKLRCPSTGANYTDRATPASQRS